MRASAEFERTLSRESQPEGDAMAKIKGEVDQGRKPLTKLPISGNG
jgi:hypothetical protein